MPIELSLPERLLMRMGVIPAPMVDLVQHATLPLLVAGYRIGIFDAIGARGGTLDELSAHAGVDAQALEVYLDLLCRLHYVRRRDGRFELTAAASRWLTVASPDSLEGMVEFLEDLVPRWRHFDQTITAGRPPFSAYDFYRDHPERWPAFHAGQRTIASFTAAEVARKAHLPRRPLRLLDVGASHGLYSVALCRRYSRLTATLLDWPEGIEAGRREIERSSMGARITTQVGDFLDDDLGDGYDVVLLGNIIHGQPPAEVTRLLRRARAATRPDGLLLIVDQVRSRWHATPFAAYVAQLMGFMLLNELGGGIYSYARVRAWLRQSGYTRVQMRRLLRTPGWVLIRAAS